VGADVDEGAGSGRVVGGGEVADAQVFDQGRGRRGAAFAHARHRDVVVMDDFIYGEPQLLP